jgi:riboflavin-specific deaminase-like protein
VERYKQRLAQAAEHCRRTGRPLVSLCYAQSLDGSLTQQRGKPLALSSPASLRLTHQLRADHAAILVGIGTVLADNPRLTVRLVDGQDPQPVILDSRLRTPVGSYLAQHRRPLIASLETSTAGPALAAAGARLLPLPADGHGRVSLPALLEKLAGMGITSLMVEGGAGVISSFLAQGLADQVVLTVAPVFVGGLNALDGEPTGLASDKAGGPAPLRRLADLETCQVEEDLWITGRVV